MAPPFLRTSQGPNAPGQMASALRIVGPHRALGLVTARSRARGQSRIPGACSVVADEPPRYQRAAAGSMLDLEPENTGNWKPLIGRDLVAARS
jgi:hypothetical protein